MMRGLERDELVTPPTTDDQHARRVMQRFLTPENDASLGSCFLISTSAGEVGFDLNADHGVFDATTIDSFIQRLGRVNRRGAGSATIVLVREKAKPKDGDQAKLEGRKLAIANTLELLKGVADVSPKNIAAMRKGVWKEMYRAACSPDPIMVELTDILLDAWESDQHHGTDARPPGSRSVAPRHRQRSAANDDCVASGARTRHEWRRRREGASNASWRSIPSALTRRSPSIVGRPRSF